MSLLFYLCWFNLWVVLVGCLVVLCLWLLICLRGLLICCFGLWWFGSALRCILLLSALVGLVMVLDLVVGLSCCYWLIGVMIRVVLCFCGLFDCLGLRCGWCWWLCWFRLLWFGLAILFVLLCVDCVCVGSAMICCLLFELGFDVGLV